MTAIFLDIDGVLNTFYTKERAPSKVIGIESAKVKVLSQIVDLCDGAVILSSSWKHDLGDDMTPLTPDGKYLTEKLLRHGITISGKVHGDPTYRGAGIVDYIKAYTEIDKILILDDEVFDYKEVGLSPFLIQTSSDKDGGLKSEHVQQAAIILERKRTRAALLKGIRLNRR